MTGHRRPMRLLMLGIVGALTWGQTVVTLTGPVNAVDATGWDGEIYVTNQAGLCGGVQVGGTTRVYKVRGGAVTPAVQLYATADCGNRPYTVVWRPKRGPEQNAYWVFEASPTSRTIASVNQPAVVQPTIPPFGIGQVSGLQALLDSLAASITGGSYGTIAGSPADNAPLAAALNGKEPAIAAGASGQYWRWDKTWAALNMAAVAGLEAALAGKEPVDAALLRSSGSYLDPDWLSLSIVKTAGLQTALDGKVSLAGSYANPGFIASLAWTKVTGVDAVPVHSSGAGVPSTTPGKAGDTYTNTDPDGLAYTAFCSTSFSCWRPGGSGTASTTPNYLQSFTAQTTVDLTHTAGTDGIVAQCFDAGGQEVGYNTLVKTSLTTARVTFSTAQTGACVVNSSGGGGAGVTGDTTSAGNSGAGAALLKAGTNITAKTLVAGANIVITPATDTITIESTASGSGSITPGSTLIESPAGTYNVNGGVIPMYLAGSASLTYGAIGNGACADLTMALTGALNGDRVVPGWPSLMPAGFGGIQFVSGANVITVRLCNHSGGAVTPSAGLTFSPMILRGF